MNRRLIRRTGTLLTGIGLILVTFAIVGFSITLPVECPANVSCAPGLFWQTYGVYYISMYLGIGLIIAGVSMQALSALRKDAPSTRPVASISGTSDLPH